MGKKHETIWYKICEMALQFEIVREHQGNIRALPSVSSRDGLTGDIGPQGHVWFRLDWFNVNYFEFGRYTKTFNVTF